MHLLIQRTDILLSIKELSACRMDQEDAAARAPSCFWSGSSWALSEDTCWVRSWPRRARSVGHQPLAWKSSPGVRLAEQVDRRVRPEAADLAGLAAEVDSGDAADRADPVDLPVVDRLEAAERMPRPLHRFPAPLRTSS